MPNETDHGPVCIGIDNGCADCARIMGERRVAGERSAPAEPEESTIEARLVALARRLDRLDGQGLGSDRLDGFWARVNETPLPQPTAADLERWRAAARETPGPMGRCIQILIAEVDRLNAEGETQRELLQRVQNYAVVDPMGNPASTVRLYGIESDIDEYLNTHPKRP